MVKPELGTKRVCPSCAIKFYDLLKDPIECPACSATFVADPILPSKNDAPPTAEPEKAAVAEEEEAEVDTDADVEVVSLEDVDEGDSDTEDADVAAAAEIADVEIARGPDNAKDITPESDQGKEVKPPAKKRTSKKTADPSLDNEKPAEKPKSDPKAEDAEIVEEAAPADATEAETPKEEPAEPAADEPNAEADKEPDPPADEGQQDPPGADTQDEYGEEITSLLETIKEACEDSRDVADIDNIEAMFSQQISFLKESTEKAYVEVTDIIQSAREKLGGE